MGRPLRRCDASWLLRASSCTPRPVPGDPCASPFPDWVEYRRNCICIDDTTHFTKAKVAVTAIEDLVCRKWIADVVSAEATSTEVHVVFADALVAEGLMARVEARQDGTVDPAVGWRGPVPRARRRGDVADAGMEADRVECLHTTASSARSTAGSSIRSRCGCSAVTWPKNDSIQAWSVGVPGRPKCWWMAQGP